MKKKILLTLLIVSVLVCLFALVASATVIDGIDYKLNSNGTATVTSSNQSYEYAEVVIPAYVTDPSTGTSYKVTEIASNGFKNNKIITSVTVPSTLEKIGGYAFNTCTKLETFIFPDDCAITAIPGNAFSYATSLKSIKIPRNVKSIGALAFKTNNRDLKFITVPVGCTLTANSVFQQYGQGLTIYYTGVEGDTGYQSLQTNAKNATIITKNHCDTYFGGVHEDNDNNPCWVTECPKCGLSNEYVGNENTHAYEYAINYDSFFEAGVKTATCPYCPDVNDVIDSALPAILTLNGFSTPVDESVKGITFGYEINNEALKAYEEVNGAVEFGFIVGVAAYVGEDALASDRVIKAPFNNAEINGYNRVDFVLTGVWEENVTVNGETLPASEVVFAMGAYVTEGETTELLNFATVTYAEVFNAPEAE